MLPEGFELVFSASEPPQTHALDRAATGITDKWIIRRKIKNG
jgi:hypothetical protein